MTGPNSTPYGDAPEEPTPYESAPEPSPDDSAPEPTPYESAPEPTPYESAPEPVAPDPARADPPPHEDPPPLGPVTPEGPAADEKAGDAEPAPEPTPEPTPEPEPPAGPVALEPPVQDPPPLGAVTPEDPASYERAGDAEPAVEPAPQPTPQPAAEPAAEPEPAAVAGRGRRRAWLPVAAVALAVALLAGTTGYLADQLRRLSAAEDGRPEAVAAARDAARLLFSYNHETLAEDFAKGLAVTTGEFRDEYRRTTQEVVTPVAERYDAVVEAEVVEAAVISSDAGEVTALVFLNQATTSTRVQGQQVDQSRVRMRLVERDGTWLVEAVEAL